MVLLPPFRGSLPLIVDLWSQHMVRTTTMSMSGLDQQLQHLPIRMAHLEKHSPGESRRPRQAWCIPPCNRWAQGPYRAPDSVVTSPRAPHRRSHHRRGRPTPHTYPRARMARRRLEGNRGAAPYASSRKTGKGPARKRGPPFLALRTLNRYRCIVGSCRPRWFRGRSGSPYSLPGPRA